MATVGGIHTVLIDGTHRHITDLNKDMLCDVWAKRQRELNELYSINASANKGWRGVILAMLGIHLPNRNGIKLGGIDSKGKPIY